jgi:hypothetical protein
MKYIHFGLSVLGLAVASGAKSAPSQQIDEYHEAIAASLIEMYEGERKQSSIVATI